MLDLASESKAIPFKQGIESVQTVLTDLKKSHPELSLKVQAVQLECNKLLTDQQQIDLEHSVYQEQFNTTRQQLLEAKAVADVEALQKELAVLPEQLESPKQLAFTNLQTKLEALQKSCQEQQIKLTGELRQGLEARQKHLEKAKMEWQQSVSQQQKTNQDTQTKLKTELRQLEERLSKRLTELTQRVNHLETWAESVKNTLGEFKDADLKAKTQIQILQTQVTQLLTEQQLHQIQRAEHQAELETLQTQLAKAPTKEEITQLETKLKAVEEQLSELSSQKLNAQPLYAKLEALQKLQEDKLKTLASTQRQEIEAQQKRLAQFKSLQTDLAQQVEKQNQQNQAQLQTLKSEVRNLEERFKKELAGVKKEVKEIKTDMTRLEAKVDAQDPRYTVATKLLKLRTAILEDQFITDELKYFVAPDGEGLQGLGDHQPLQEWVQHHFLEAKAEARVLLLQGVAGAGKSTFNRYLMRQLWQDDAWKTFKPGMPAPKVYLPIFIPLGSPQIQPSQLLKYLNNLPELIDDLTDAEINVLKTDYQLLLIADGYDEMPVNQKLNLYDSNQLHQYPAIKLVIGCRTQRAQELNENDVFTPHTTSGQAQYSYFKRRHVSPFNDAQIKDCISKYLAQNQGRLDVVLWKESQTYVEQLSKLPDLKALLTTPFALLMSIEVMPSIAAEAEKTAKGASEIKGDSKESKETKTSQVTKFTRAKLYDAFMDHWFKRQAEKARQAGDTTNAKILIQHYRQFCFKLAERLRAAGITAVQYPFGEEALFEEDLLSDTPKEVVDPKGPRGPWVKKLLGPENEAMVRTRKGAPLTVATGNYYQFIHASLIDYFSTTAMADQLQPAVVTQPTDNKSETLVLQDTASSSLEELLGDKPMSRDQWYLLADRVQQEPEFTTKLLKIIAESKQEAKLALAASNAITVLNAAGVNLSDQDFRGIRIPGADLSGALLHSTQFQGADLTGVNFQSAWLAEAKLQQAKLGAIRFGEQTYIQVNIDAKEGAWACEYSPNGNWLAVAAWNVIEVYEASSRRLVCRLTGHTHNVRSVSWDKASERLASGSGDKTVRVWEVSTGKELCCLKGHTDRVGSVSWDKVSERLASGSEDCTVRVWEVSTEKELHCLKGHTWFVASVSWDSAGERLASGSWDKTVRVWEVSTGRVLCSLVGHTDRVSSVSWDPAGKRLASGGFDNTVRVWEVSTGKELHSLSGHTDFVYSISWDPAGERLASGSSDRTVRLWEVSTGKVLRSLEGHTDTVTSVSWDPAGEHLASGSCDYTVRVWEVSIGKELRSLQGHTDIVRSIAWDPAGERLTSGSNDHSVRVWEVSMGKELLCFGHTNQVTSVSWDQTGKRLASNGKTVRVCEVSTGKELCALKGDTKSVTSIDWDQTGERLATGSLDCTVRVWEVSTGKELRCLRGHGRWVDSVSWDPKGERLASGSTDHTVRVWEVSTGKELRCLKGHTDTVNSISWDPAGERLASGSSDHTVRVWEVSTGKVLRCLKGHTNNVTSVSWDKAGERLVSGSGDRTVRVWEVSTSKELYQLLLPQRVREIAITSLNGSKISLAVAFGKAIGCFELIAKDDTYTSHLKWLATDGTVGLHLAGVDLTDAQDLSADNYGLLKQRGAIGKPADIPLLETKESKNNTRGDSKNETKLTGVTGLAAAATQLGVFTSGVQSPAKGTTKAPVEEFKTTPQHG